MRERVEDPKTVRQRFVLIVVALGAGWVWFRYGMDALVDIALVMGVVLALLRLGPGIGKRRTVDFSVPHLGPSERDIDLDPMFRMFSHNIWHNRKSD